MSGALVWKYPTGTAFLLGKILELKIIEVLLAALQDPCPASLLHVIISWDRFVQVTLRLL